MKRKLLSDEECMSGTGWYPEGCDVECPECGHDIELINYETIINCSDCKTKLIIEYGKLHLWKVKIHGK